MRNLTRIILLLFSIAIPLFCQGQWKKSSDGKYLLKINPNQKNSVKELILAELTGFDPQSELRSIRTSTNKSGTIYHRFGQFYHGLRVLEAEVVIYEKNEQIRGGTGRFIADLDLSVQPSINEDQALEKALIFLNADNYAWENENYEQMLKIAMKDESATFLPDGELIIVSPDLNTNPDTYRLAYEFDIFSLNPISRQRIIVDAHTGNILRAIEELRSCFLTGTGMGNYFSGMVEFTVDSCGGPYFRLRSSINSTFDAAGSTNNFYLDIFDLDNVWTESTVRNGVDAHWGTQKVHEYFLNTFGLDSYDGEGASMLSWVNFGQGYLGAFWNGAWINLGTGNGQYQSLTSLDIVAHEWTHAIIQYSSKLANFREPGVIAEGLCDYFGCLIEQIYDPENGNYKVADRPDGLGNGFRWLHNPVGHQLHPSPDTYLGDYWQSIEGCSPSPVNDYCGIHKNSTVISHLLFLLSEGGSGLNDFGLQYEIEPIGPNKTAELAFNVMTGYLTPLSDFWDFRQAAIDYASNALNFSESDIQQIINAFCAVGIGSCELNLVDTLTLNHPNGGEIFQVGNIETITWESSANVEFVNIYVSINGGGGYTQVATNVPNSGAFEWTVPNFDSYQCRIRITDAYDPLVRDISDETFVIIGCNALAYFEVNSQELCIGNVLYAINYSSSLVTSIVWEKDGQIISDTQDILQLPIIESGTFLLTLHVYMDDNCIDSYSRSISVSIPTSPEFTFVVTDQTILAVAEQNNVDEYFWTFEGMQAGNTSSLSLVAPGPGNYEVCLNVEDACGSLSTCKLIAVEDQPVCEGSEEQWEQIVNAYDVREMAFEGDTIWMATSVGIVLYNKTTEENRFYTTANSLLPHPDVNTVDIGPDGKKWFGTDGGVVVIQDVEITEVFNSQNVNWMSNNEVRVIRIDESGNAWIATQGGLIKYLPSGEDPILFNWVENILINNVVGMGFVDGETWLGIDQIGLVKIDTMNSITLFDLDDGFPVNNNLSMSFVHVANNGLIYFSYYPVALGSFNRIDTWETFNLSMFQFTSPDAITEYPDGNLLIGSYARLFVFDGDTISNIIPIPNTYNIETLKLDENNLIWLGSKEKGLAKFEGELQLLELANSPILSSPTAVTTDQNGNTWFALKNKIIRFDSEAFHEFLPNIIPFPEELNHIVVDSYGRVWAGGDERLYRISIYGDNSTWLSFDLPHSNIYPYYQELNDLVLTTNDVCYAATTGGLLKIENSIPFIYTEQNGLLYKPVSAVESAGSDSVWISYYGTDSLTLFDGQQNFVHYGPPSNLNIGQIRELATGPNGKLWMSNFFSGNKSSIYTFHPGNLDWEYIPEIGNSLNFDIITDITFSPLGTLVIGTIKNLGLYDLGTQEISVYNTLLPGLPGNYILGVSANEQATFVITTNGAAILYPASGAINPTFSYENTEGCAGVPVHFFNQTVGATSFSWSINNVAVGSMKNLTYTFPEPGTYTVTLSAYNSEVCEVKYSEIITVSPTVEMVSLDAIVAECSSSVLLDAGVDGLIYEWQFNGELKGTERTQIAEQAGYYILNVQDLCGNSATYPVTVILGSCVWPGDLDSDNEVTPYDLLNLGVAYGSFGTARLDANGEWFAQPSTDWGEATVNDIDFKHIDANGNGVIDNADFFVFESNLGKIHGAPSEEPDPSPSPFSLAPEISASQIGDNQWQLEVTITVQHEDGLLMDNIYGIAFGLYYDFPDMEIQGIPFIDFQSGDISNSLDEVLFVSQPIIARKLIRAAIVRTDHQNQDAIQTIGTGNIIVVDNIATGDSIQLSVSIEGIKAITNDGNIIPMNGNTGNLNFIINSTDSPQKARPDIKLFPNPTSETTYLQVPNGIRVEQIRIFNSQGNLMEIMDQNLNTKTMIHLREFPSGLYYCEIYTDEGYQLVKRLVKI